MMHKAWCSIENKPYSFFKFNLKFRGHVGTKSLILTRIERFRTVTTAWIHWWCWNDAQRLMWYRRGVLLISKVIDQISRSHRTKKSLILTRIERFRTVTPVWIHRWLWNEAHSLMYYKRGVLLFFEVIHQISRLHGPNIDDLNSILSKITRPVAAIKSLRFALFFIARFELFGCAITEGVTGL